MTNQRTVKVYVKNGNEHVAFNNATFTIRPDDSATITIDEETRAYFPPFSYDYITTE